MFQLHNYFEKNNEKVFLIFSSYTNALFVPTPNVYPNAHVTLLLISFACFMTSFDFESV